MEKLLEIMISYRESLKLFHFQTSQFSYHKITDDIIKEYDELFDKFWEVYQGIYGKLNINNMNCQVKGWNKQMCIKDTTELINILNYINEKVLTIKLNNIKEEIVDLLYKFQYLLQFK